MTLVHHQVQLLEEQSQTSERQSSTVDKQSAFIEDLSVTMEEQSITIEELSRTTYKQTDLIQQLQKENRVSFWYLENDLCAITLHFSNVSFYVQYIL